MDLQRQGMLLVNPADDPVHPHMKILDMRCASRMGQWLVMIKPNRPPVAFQYLSNKATAGARQHWVPGGAATGGREQGTSDMLQDTAAQ